MFIGTTRSHTQGKGDTVRLEYDCYEEMATAEMRRLCLEVMGEWSVEHLFIIHRIGPVPAGEASVVIAASAAHRDAAIESCRCVIDTLKKTVPIWKKEIYADGRTEWVQGATPSGVSG
jgi:molybdopterin synthase catalytic subunit